MPHLSHCSFISADITALSGFYAAVLDLDELTELGNDIYRALDAGHGVHLAFSATKVHEMLGLPGEDPLVGTTQYPTFEVAAPDEVEQRTTRAVGLGATLLHEPYNTYYGTYQSVLSDPDGNPFRLNHTPGASA